MKFTLIILIIAGVMAWLTGCANQPQWHSENLSPVQVIIKDARIQRIKEACETCQRDNEYCVISDGNKQINCEVKK